MSFGTQVDFTPIGIVLFGALPVTYGPLGAPIPGHARIIRLCNSTDAFVLISADGVTDNLQLAPNSFILFDFTANKVQEDGYFVIDGTQFYLKGSGATKGSVWIEVITATGGV